MTVTKLTRSPTTRIERVAVATTEFLSEAFLHGKWMKFTSKKNASERNAVVATATLSILVVGLLGETPAY